MKYPKFRMSIPIACFLYSMFVPIENSIANDIVQQELKELIQDFQFDEATTKILKEDLTDLQKIELEALTLSVVKPISASDWKLNSEGYKLLSILDRNNQMYVEKWKQYSNRPIYSKNDSCSGLSDSFFKKNQKMIEISTDGNLICLIKFHERIKGDIRWTHAEVIDFVLDSFPSVILNLERKRFPYIIPNIISERWMRQEIKKLEESGYDIPKDANLGIGLQLGFFINENIDENFNPYEIVMWYSGLEEGIRFGECDFEVKSESDFDSSRCFVTFPDENQLNILENMANADESVINYRYLDKDGIMIYQGDELFLEPTEQKILRDMLLVWQNHKDRLK